MRFKVEEEGCFIKLQKLRVENIFTSLDYMFGLLFKFEPFCHLFYCLVAAADDVRKHLPL
jgi:hypothetical protein